MFSALDEIKMAIIPIKSVNIMRIWIAQLYQNRYTRMISST